MREIQKYRNQQLFERLKKLVIRAFVLLDEKVKRGAKFAPRTVEKISIDEAGRLVIFPLSLREYYRKPDFSSFISKHNNEIKQLSEWTSASEHLSKDEIIRKHISQQIRFPFGGEILDESSILHKVLWMSVDEENPFQFDQEIFELAYSRMEDYFYSKTVTRKSVCLLLGFDAEAEEIDLGDGLKIRKISNDEILELWQRSTWFRGLAEISSEFRFTPLRYALEWSLEVPKLVGDEKYEYRFADEEFEKVVSALRLFKKGWVDYPFIVERITLNLSSGLLLSMKHSKRGIMGSQTVHRARELSYRLSRKESEDFKQYYKKAKRKIDCSDIPLRRFNETYQRQSDEDKIIDYMISFESLFLARESPSEMGYKLAHRVSLLLGENEARKKEIFLEMKKAYTVRSDIVHGRKIRSITIREKKLSLSEFVQQIEEHLRLSIRVLLGNKKMSWIDLMFK